MYSIAQDLLDLTDRLESIVSQIDRSDINDPLSDLEDATSAVDKAASGSWFGYHARVYYHGLRPPPPGARFSPEWGLMDQVFVRETTGNWIECDPDEVKRAIRPSAGDPDLTQAESLRDRAREAFVENQSEVLSLLSDSLQERDDPFLQKLEEDAEKVKLYSRSDFTKVLRPSGVFVTKDMIALNQGVQVPPHVSVAIEAALIRQPVNACAELSKIARRAGSHLAKRGRRAKRDSEVGTNVFIGHGRSLLWRELKDFIQDRLRLPCDEFNQVPYAGTTNIARLSHMLDDAAMAFLIMTAEDEQHDGRMHAGQNVIHEAGLFQGRLGFTRAIVLLEEGCETFSNIEGLGHIPFPRGNVKAAFEEVRQVLEREGLFET